MCKSRSSVTNPPFGSYETSAKAWRQRALTLRRPKLIQEFLSYVTVNTMHLAYDNQPVNAVQCNYYCWPHEWPHKGTVWTKCMFLVRQTKWYVHLTLPFNVANHHNQLWEVEWQFLNSQNYWNKKNLSTTSLSIFRATNWKLKFPTQYKLRNFISLLIWAQYKGPFDVVCPLHHPTICI